MSLRFCFGRVPLWCVYIAYVSIRLHTSAYVSIRLHTSAYACIRQHTSAYASIRQHTSAYVSTRQHTSAYGPGDYTYSSSMKTHI